MHAGQSASRLKEEQAKRQCESAQFFEECLSTPLWGSAGNASSSSASKTSPGADSSPHSSQTMSWPHMVQKPGNSSPRVVCERDRERPTVGSCATSWVMPAVSPTEDAISWRIMHDEDASSVKLQVRQAKSSLLFSLSSRGNSRLELWLY